MKVREIMTKEPKCCGLDTNLATAAELMWKNDCGVLPVVDDGKLAGIITDRDICIALGTRNQRACDVRVSDVVCRATVLCRPDDHLRSALKTMAEERVRRLRVIHHDGTLVGILSLDDITLQARHRGDTDPPPVSFEDVMQTLRAICHRGSRSSDHLPEGA